MARLNEPSISVETIDALKRRFIRQNRDIARVNSTQSLRIRNLESEVSRLLSENLSLRERVVRLQYESDKRVEHSVFDDMGTVRRKIETKLTELGGFVQELTNLQTSVENRRPKRRSSIRNSPKKSPDQKNWKNSLTLSEVTCGGDGRLPPIVEDKYFPRKTLDAEEFHKILPDVANVNDSPEIGPPPVAHFEEGDPVNFYPERRYIASKTSPKLEGKGRPDTLSNLGARKKRRETSNLRQPLFEEAIISESLQSLQSPVKSLSNSQPFKSGAKRKLNTREAEDKVGPTNTLDADSFLFDRRSVNLTNTSPVKQDITKMGGLGSHILSQDLSKGMNSTKAKDITNTMSSKSRKVLGPKNANTDPTSPTKLSRPIKNDKIAEYKDPAAKKIVDRNLKEKPPRSHDTGLKSSDPTNATGLSTDAVKAGPETPIPATNNLLSPVMSEPSVTRQDSRDTPPPSDLDPDTAQAAAFSAAGRATRRPRGSVSYAEPNLRAKMRRPTNDLVDAVGTSERLQNVVVVKDGENSGPDSAPEKSGLRTVVIKKEDLANPINSWKIPSSTENQTHFHRLQDEERSPSANRNHISLAELPVSIMTDRRRRTVGVQSGEDESYKKNSHTSNAGSTIASHEAENQRPRKHDENRVVNDQTDAEDGSRMKASLRPEASTKGEDGKNGAITKTTRRHSNMPTEETKFGGAGAREAAMAKARERKRELRLSAALHERTGTELSSVKSMAGLQGRESTQAGLVGRAERAATRRRSMML